MKTILLSVNFFLIIMQGVQVGEEKRKTPFLILLQAGLFFHLERFDSTSILFLGELITIFDLPILLSLSFSPSKTMRLWELIRIFSTNFIGDLLEFDTIRLQLDQDVYLRLLSQPENPDYNVIIFRGGCSYFGNKIGYYSKILCALSSNIRFFQFEKMAPAVNFNMTDDIDKVITYVKKNYSGKIILVGFSMGGIVIMSYLASGKDNADGYLTVCSPINLKYFVEQVNSNYIYKNVQQQTCIDYGVENVDDLYLKANTNRKEIESYIENFGEKLSAIKIFEKVGCIIGAEDLLTLTFENDANELKLPITILKISGATHCCISCVHRAHKVLEKMKMNISMHEAVIAD